MRTAALLVAIAACGDNVVYPPGELFEGAEYCCGRMAVGGGYVFFNQLQLVRVPATGGGAAMVANVEWAGLAADDDNVLGVTLAPGQDIYVQSIPFSGGALDTLWSPYGNLLAYGETLTSDGLNAYLINDFGAMPFEVWRQSEAGTTIYGGMLFVAFAVRPSADSWETQIWQVALDGSTGGRVATLPGLRLQRIAADDKSIYVAGLAGLVRIARADSSVTMLDDTPIADVIDVSGAAYALSAAPSIARYDDSGSTTLVEIHGREFDVIGDYVAWHGWLATDGARLFYTGTTGSNGFIRYLDL